VIRNVNIFTGAGPLIRNGAVLMQDGKIAAIGQNVTAPADAVVIDGGGRYVTPGLIDTHSHLGVYPAPGTAAHSDGNELTNPVTAYVWAEHSVWPQDPQFPRALAGGVTALQVLPGSGNLIGGRGVTLNVVPGRSVQDL
jgi:imidazolonepropionase-like amidohydrolase